MYTSNTLRQQFTDSALETASGPRIVVMCFDRLDRDLGEAIAALGESDFYRAHIALCHAQDIVHELLLMLDRGAWEHAGALAAIYEYVLRQLAAANISKSAALAAEARHLLAQLGDSFRTAATMVAMPVVASSGGPGIDQPRWSMNA